jgi:hypothetical protein
MVANNPLLVLCNLLTVLLLLSYSCYNIPILVEDYNDSLW